MYHRKKKNTEIKKLTSRLLSVLLIVVILAADFNYLPAQSVMKQSVSKNIITAYAAATKPGKWIKESNGKWWYKHTDGTYTKNDWEYIDGYWYHFDANGWMQVSWLKVDGKWYHLNGEGKMHIGWVKIGNYWYHFDSNGVRQTGWQKLNGNWYYFNSDGIRQVGWQQVDGKWYHLNSEGIMETGWVKIGTDWYYFHSNGVRYVGWLPENGKTYHFNSSGIMDIGWKKINNYWYHFNRSGVMNTDTLKENTRTYYFNSSNGRLYCTELGVNEEEQRGEHWCWAACAVMVGTYNTNSIATQEDIVAKIKGSSDIDEGGTKYEHAQAIYYASNRTKSVTSYEIIDFEDIVSEIDSNKPFSVTMQWDSGSGAHAIVCAGYNVNNNSIRIIDPAKGCGVNYYKYNDIINGTTIKSGKGKCIRMLTYKFV